MTDRADTSIEIVADKLIRASERRCSPAFSRIRFPAQLDITRPLMPETLLSLYGHPALLAMDSPTRWRLSLLETVNFFSLNIHGEQALVAEMADRLYRGRCSSESVLVSRYLQHFIHDENSHTYMLAEFCNRYYGSVMPEIVYRFETPSLSRTGADLLFFGRVFVLETLLAFVNRTTMHDETLDPTVCAIHRSHHQDETRHMAFDRAVITNLSSKMRGQDADNEIRAVEALLHHYAEYAFSRLVNPRVYRELGMENPLALLREVRTSDHRLRLKAEWRCHVDSFFRKVGLFATDAERATSTSSLAKTL